MKAVKQLLYLMNNALKSMIFAISLSFFTVSANIGLMSSAAYLISCAALHPPLAALTLTITCVRFFGISRAVFRYGERYVSHNATFKILYALRIWFYEKIEPLAPAVLNRFRSGDLLARIISDIDTLQFFYLRVIEPPMVAVLVALGMGVFLSFFSGDIAILLVVSFVIAGVIVPIATIKEACRDSAENLHLQGKFKADVTDMLDGMRDLTANFQRETQRKILIATAGNLQRIQKKAAYRAANAEAVTVLAMHIGVFGTFIIGSNLAINGGIDKIYLAAIVLAVQASFEAVQPMATSIAALADGQAAAKRLFDLTAMRAQVSENGMAVPSDTSIIFERVGLRYDGETRMALEDISFSVPEGGKIAVIGASGAGKTSLIRLLVRFWDPSAGKILLGGKSLKDINSENVRNKISVVSQETYIFNASIGENILLANPQATDEEFKKAIHHASLTEFVSSLPNKADSAAGLGGGALSGGQRQRIAIARAVIKDAPILILDEPFNGLDAITADEINSSLQKLMKGRTTILITHHLIGLEEMDEILVMVEGRIVERGNLIELLSRQGVFTQMYHMECDTLPGKYA